MGGREKPNPGDLTFSKKKPSNDENWGRVEWNNTIPRLLKKSDRLGRGLKSGKEDQKKQITAVDVQKRHKVTTKGGVKKPTLEKKQPTDKRGGKKKKGTTTPELFHRNSKSPKILQKQKIEGGDYGTGKMEGRKNRSTASVVKKRQEGNFSKGELKTKKQTELAQKAVGPEG